MNDFDAAWERAQALGAISFELIYDSQYRPIELRVVLEGVWEARTDGQSESSIIVYSIKGSSEKLQQLITPEGLFGLLHNSVNAVDLDIKNLSPSSIAKELDDLFIEVQKATGVTCSYEKKRKKVTIPEKPFFDLQLSGDWGVSLGIGITGTISENSLYTIEKGRIIGTRFYSESDYTEQDYVNIETTLGEVYLKALTDMITVVQNMWNQAKAIVQQGQELLLDAGQASLQIAADVVEAGKTIAMSYASGVQQQSFGVMALTDTVPEVSDYFGIGGIYHLEPYDQILSGPGSLTLSYTDVEASGYDETKFMVYRWDDVASTWILVGGTVDIVANNVTVSIDRLGIYTIGVQVPYGQYAFMSTPDTASADGTSTVMFTSEQILNNDSSVVADGSMFTVNVSCGTILSVDEDSVIAGTQVSTTSGILQITLEAPLVASNATVKATSMEGLATIAGAVEFTDSIPPQAPEGLVVDIVEGKVHLTWVANQETDIAGYKIHFDNDQSGLPYEGIAYYSGTNSPVDVADANSCFLKGLLSGETYYIALTAYDVSGNESLHGAEVAFNNILPPDSDSDGLPDEWEGLYANYANGLDPTAYDAHLDNDNDGLTNWEEYSAQSDPVNSIAVELTSDKSWIYQSLPNSTNCGITIFASSPADPMNNSSYTYQWEVELPADCSTAPTVIAGGGPTDNFITLAASSCSDMSGISDSALPHKVKLTVIGNDHQNTGSNESEFYICLLGDANNDGVVDVIDRAIINAFVKTGVAGPFTLVDCDINCDGLVDVTDRAIIVAISQGTLCGGSVSVPCPVR